MRYATVTAGGARRTYGVRRARVGARAARSAVGTVVRSNPIEIERPAGSTGSAIRIVGSTSVTIAWIAAPIRLPMRSSVERDGTCRLREEVHRRGELGFQCRRQCHREAIAGAPLTGLPEGRIGRGELAMRRRR